MDTLFDFAVKGMKAQAEVLCHAKDPETSREAAEKMIESGKLARQEKMIYNEIIRYNEAWWKDFTTKDIAKWMAYLMGYDKAYDICRKRFSGLKNKGKIERTGGKREGCCVWRLKER